MPSVDELYTTVDAKEVSRQAIIANQPVGKVLGLTWSFGIGTVPTATIRVPYPAPASVVYFADVAIDVGFNGVLERVFTGKVLNVNNSEQESTIECAGLSMFLERPNEDVAIGLDNKTNIDAIAEVFAAAGIDYFTTAIPSFTMGTNNPSVLEFQTFAEAITKIAEIEGGRWAELPTGQIRVAVYDPIAASVPARTYFSMTLTGGVESYPSDLTVADGRPRIRTIRKVQKVQLTKNRVHVNGATVTEEIAPGVESSHEIKKTQSSASPLVLGPDGTQAFNDMVFSNDLIDTFNKADQVALRLLSLHSRLKEELSLQVEGDPLRRLGETIRVEDASYAGLTDRWFLESYRTTLTQTSFFTSLKLLGTGASLDIDPVAAFTYKAVWMVIDDDLYVIVTLDGRPSFDPDGSIVSYAWTDNQAPMVATGPTAVLTICKKTFEAGGDIIPPWQVTLTVTDSDGNTDAVTQTIDLTLCDKPPLPNVVAPSLFSALGNNYAGSADAGVFWHDQAATSVISVAADPAQEGRAVFGQTDGGIYRTEDTVFSAPSNVLAAVGSPIVSLAWDDEDFDVVWGLTQDGRVYRSANAGAAWVLYRNLRTVFALPNLRGGKILPIGGAVIVFGGEGNGEPLITLDQFKGNSWVKVALGGDLRSDLDSAAASGAPVATGSYVGSGVGQSIVVGFEPDCVIVFQDGRACMIKGVDSVWGTRSAEMDGSVNAATGITSLTATGFTVGADANVDQGGQTFHWLAIGGGTSFVKSGTYVSAGGGGAAISGVGFTPAMVTVHMDGPILGVVKTNTMSGLDSKEYGSSIFQTDEILSLDADGFTYGAGTSANSIFSDDFLFIAFSAQAGLTLSNYVGDGVDGRQIAVGDFNFLMLLPDHTEAAHLKIDTMAADAAKEILNAGAIVANVIQDDDPFEVGDDDAANLSPENYHWIGFRDASTPTDLYIADAAFNGGFNLWELAIIINSASFQPSVHYTINLLGDGSDWQRATGLPLKSRGIWIAADLLPDRFTFGFDDEIVYLGDVAAGVIATTVAAAALAAGDAPNHGFWMGQFIPDVGSVYILSSESAAPDGDIYISCDRFATVGRVRPAAGFPAMPATATAEMTTIGAIPSCPELYVQEETTSFNIARLDFNVYTDLGNDADGDDNWHLIFLNGVAYRIVGSRDAPSQGGNFGRLDRSIDIGGNVWVEVLGENVPNNEGVRTVTIDAAGNLWAAYFNDTIPSGTVPLKVYKSIDNGLTWLRIFTGFEFSDPGGDANARDAYDIACDTADSNRLIIASSRAVSTEDFLSSADGGVTWTSALHPGGGLPGLGHWVKYGDSHRIINVMVGGVWISDDNGASWVQKLTIVGKTGVPWLIKNPDNPQQLIACWNDPGVGAGQPMDVRLTRDNGETWERIADGIIIPTWPASACWSGVFLDDGSLVIAARPSENIFRNPNPFAMSLPDWQDWTYNLAGSWVTGGQGLATSRVEMEP